MGLRRGPGEGAERGPKGRAEGGRRESAGLVVASRTPGLARAERSPGSFRSPSSSFGGLWGWGGAVFLRLVAF